MTLVTYLKEQVTRVDHCGSQQLTRQAWRQYIQDLCDSGHERERIRRRKRRIFPRNFLQNLTSKYTCALRRQAEEDCPSSHCSLLSAGGYSIRYYLFTGGIANFLSDSVQIAQVATQTVGSIPAPPFQVPVITTGSTCTGALSTCTIAHVSLV